jgi:restriction endonuclease S subunit
MKFNIDKSKWKKVKLGSVAFEYSKRINNPSESEFDRFVGSSNIGQWDFRVQSWEATDSVTSAMKLFEPNDYLLVRRSLYASDFRERAPRAHFSGVCSGDILTIKENPEKIIDGFLIGVLNSPALWKYVVANASGSITRRIKWKDLANYEFLLPPKDQQAKLAKLLWAMDDVVEKEKEVLEKLDFAYNTVVDNLFSKKNEDWKFLTLNKIASINKKSLNSKTDFNYKFKYLDLASIIKPKIIGELRSVKLSEAPSRAKRIVEDDSIILAMVRPYQRAFAYVHNGENIIASTGTAVINLNEPQLSRFVFHQFFSRRFTKYCEDRMTGTSYPAITPRDVEEFKISIPRDETIILKEAQKMDELEAASFSTRNKIESSKSLQKSLINQVF